MSLLIIENPDGSVGRVVTGLQEMRNRARNLAPVFRQVSNDARDQWATEFDSEAGYTPSGGLVSWRRTQAFGNIPAPSKTLDRSGRLRAAVAGGAGSIEEIEADGMRIGISGSAVPYAVVHRGTSGFQVLSNVAGSVETIGVTDRMRAFLRANGVFLRSATTSIRIPRRPFMSWTAPFQTRVTQLLASYVLSGEAEADAA